MLSSLAALPSAKLGLLPWKPPLAARAAELRQSLAAAEPEALLPAVAAAAEGRLRMMLQGIAAYQAHTYRRDLADPPVLWSRGPARLLDYGAGRSSATTALFVPSLVNRAYILDLSRRQSLLRWLATQGIRPLLLDWGLPGPRERRFHLGNYIDGPLAGALTAAATVAGRPVALLGYCMGGTLAVAAAARQPEHVGALALLAAPWDFHAGAGHGHIVAALRAGTESLLDELGELPVDLLQALFLALDPSLSLRKFAGFAALDPASAAAEEFVALEDWVNDGVPLAGPVARECLLGWYGENQPMRGCWQVCGEPVRPDRLRLPSLVVVPHNDRIVPPASAAALAGLIPGAATLRPAAGHIGMVVGSKAMTDLWGPLADWLLRAMSGSA
jgi:polyhydroxyalkanoate synthase